MEPNKYPGKFAFIIHPLDKQDIINFEPRVVTKREELIKKMFEWMPPFKTSNITGIKSLTGDTAEGWFISCPFLPEQFLELPLEKVYKKIIEACKLAEELGAKIIGLGAYTSVVGDAGETIARNLNIPVTSGSSYTIATAVEATIKAAKLMNIDISKERCAIVGATGAIGRACAKMLIDKVGRIILVGRNKRTLQKVKEEIEDFAGIDLNITTDIKEALQQSKLVISATSSVKSVIEPSYPLSGSVICDVALPHDVCREVALQRDDVLVIEGGLVRVPGDVDFGYDFGYPKGVALACMAETMILALEKRYVSYSLGRKIPLNKVQEITELATKHGFSLEGFRSFDRWLSQEEIMLISKKANSYKLSNRRGII